jgi:putative ABC transport system ATP-binding protein
MLSVITLRGVKREYLLGNKKDVEITVRALRGVNFSAEAGEFVAIMGPSGSGKSTLMNVLGCLDKPTEGTYVLDGIETTRAGSDAFAQIRNKKIGFVFQAFNLLARTSALENVELPLLYAAKEKTGAQIRERNHRERAAAVLQEVGLGNRLNHVSSQLSGGQQQRVAIARALVNDPAFILADEPTGNLDSEMSLEIMSLFQALNRRGKTIIMVTHEPDIACYTQRILTLRDGQIESDKRVAEDRDAAGDLEKWRAENALLKS